MGASKFSIINKMNLITGNSDIVYENIFDMNYRLEINDDLSEPEVIPSPCLSSIGKSDSDIKKFGIHRMESKTLSQSQCSMSHTEDKPAKKREPLNPNLLKNVVATLRKWIKVSPDQNSVQASILWKHFMTASKINLKLIKNTFGAINPAVKEIQEFIQQVGSPEIDILCIQKGQEYLRECVLRQLYDNDINYIIKNSRAKNKEKFKAYFMSIVEKLQSGGINSYKQLTKKE